MGDHKVGTVVPINWGGGVQNLTEEFIKDIITKIFGEFHYKEHNPFELIGEAYVPGLGTIRECIDCGCLVAGGPTRCKRCAKEIRI